MVPDALGRGGLGRLESDSLQQTGSAQTFIRPSVGSLKVGCAGEWEHKGQPWRSFPVPLALLLKLMVAHTLVRPEMQTSLESPATGQPTGHFPLVLQ